MSKNGDKAKPKRKDPNERVRKIGEREEIIESKLTQLQIDEMQRENMVLDNEIERLDEKKAEAMKNFASQLKTIELQKSELRRMVNSGRRRETVIVDEHLTASNEVIRIRRDTGEQIGARTATPRELQEEMFPDKQDAPEVPQGDPAPEATDSMFENGEEPG